MIWLVCLGALALFVLACWVAWELDAQYDRRMQ